MSRTVSLTPDHGTALLRAARGLVYPKEVGGQKFSGDELSTFARWQIALWKALRKHSPIFRENSKLEFFGPREWYTEVKITPEERRKSGVDVDHTYIPTPEALNKTEEVSLTETECKMVFLICLTWLHPEYEKHLNPALQDELAWNLIRQLGGKTVAQMEKAVGLDANKGYEVALGDAETESAPAVRAPAEGGVR